MRKLTRDLASNIRITFNDACRTATFPWIVSWEEAHGDNARVKRVTSFKSLTKAQAWAGLLIPIDLTL